MTRVAVLGGSGFLGSRAVGALRRTKLAVSVASRRSEIAVDVRRPETYAALALFDVVVDLSDSVSHPPDELVAWCLARDKIVLEATSEARCVERLHAAHADTRGRLVLGGGIFTGVSNLLARDVVRRAGRPEHLTLGIASSPFSGAGKGTIELMLRALEVAAVRYERGERVEEPRVRRLATLDFGGVARPAGTMSLAEPYMLFESTKVPSVDVLFAPKPSMLLASFEALPPALLRRRWFQALLRGYFTVLRRVLLGSVPSAVELVAIAKGEGDEVRRVVSAADGMEAGGFALAAMTEALVEGPTWTGARFIDDVCELEPIIARANALAGDELLTVR